MWSSTASAARDVLGVADAPAVAEQRVRVRRAAHPRDVHVVAVAALADAVAVERRRLDQPRRIGPVVPAVAARTPRAPPPRRRDTQAASSAGDVPARRSTRRQSPSLCSNASSTRSPGLPAVRLDVRRRGRLGAVVAERLLAVREVEPDQRAAVAVGEADARLAERATLAS